MSKAGDKGVEQGIKEAFLAGTDDNTDREPTSGVAHAQRQTNKSTKTIIRKRDKQRPPGPTTPKTPAELGDDTRQ